MQKWKTRRKYYGINEFLYRALPLLAMLFIIISSFVFFEMYQYKLGKDGGALAVKETAAALLILLPVIPPLAGVAILANIGYKKGIPLVGRSKSRGAAEKPKKPLSPKKAAAVALAVVLWLASFVLVIGAAQNRVEITETHINTYAMFGKLEESRPIEDAVAVEATINSEKKSRSAIYRYSMSYIVYFADGEHFTFTAGAYAMQKIDGLFAGVPKTVSGTEHFEKLCEKNGYSPEEREKLQEVFLITD